MEMTIEYKRDWNRSCVLFSLEEELRRDSFQVQMVLTNQVPSILPCWYTAVDNQWRWCHEITGCQSLKRYSQLEPFNAQAIGWILDGILTGMEQCREYLLDVSHVYLNPEQIYVNAAEQKIYFCFLPFYLNDPKEYFGKLGQFILTNLNQQEPEAVTLGYNVYRLLQQGIENTDEIRKLLYGTEKKAQSYEPDPIREQERKEAMDRFFQDEDDELEEGFWKEVFLKERLQKEKHQKERPMKEGFSNGEARKESDLDEHLFKRWIFKDNGAGELLDNLLPVGMITCFGLTCCIVLFLFRNLWGIPPLILYLCIGGCVILTLGGMVITLTFRKRLGRKNGLRKDGKYDRKPGRKNDGRQDRQQEEEEQRLYTPDLYEEDVSVFQQEDQFLGSLNKSTKNDLRDLGDPGDLDDFGLDPGTQLLSLDQIQFNHAALTWEHGSGGHFSLEKEITCVGKKADWADFLITDSVVSRMHARIVRQGGSYYLEDLNSKNGTYLNGQLLDYGASVSLSHGDTIQFANLSYTFIKSW